MDTNEARETGYVPKPIQPLITVSKSFSLALIFAWFRRKKVVIPKEDLKPTVDMDGDA